MRQSVLILTIFIGFFYFQSVSACESESVNYEDYYVSLAIKFTKLSCFSHEPYCRIDWTHKNAYSQVRAVLQECKSSKSNIKDKELKEYVSHFIVPVFRVLEECKTSSKSQDFRQVESKEKSSHDIYLPSFGLCTIL